MMRVDLAASQIQAVRIMLADQFEDDERGWLDFLEGETDLFEIARRLLEKMEAEEGDREALTEQMDARKVRRDRCDGRIKGLRDSIAALMECAGVDKLPLPEATVSLRQLAASLKVNDPAAVPDEYLVPKFAPDLAKIKEAFDTANDDLPNWLRVEPPRASLTIRRK
jgi:hypothetical protein